MHDFFIATIHSASAAARMPGAETDSLKFWFVTVVFILTFVAIASEKINKTTAALFGASLMMLVILPGPLHEPVRNGPAAPSAVQQIETTQSETFYHEQYQKLDMFSRYVNFDVLFTLAGMMVIVNILSGTGLFQYIAIKSAKFAKGQPIRTMILLVISTAVLSAFLDNVTTILLIVPVTIVIASELKLSPMPFLMAETFASNIGGTATLIGDPPNLIIGSAVGLNFMAFLKNLAPFIAFLIIIYCIVLSLHYKKKMKVTVEQQAHIMELDDSETITDRATLIKAGIAMGVTLIGFLFHGMLGLQPCVVAMSGAALCLALCNINVEHALEKVEWGTLFFFLGLFVLVEGASYAGLMEKIGGLLVFTESWHPLLTILAVMWFCASCIFVINNVSFTAVAVSIIMSFMKTHDVFAGNAPLQNLMWWGVALSVCLGGNFSLLGAAANLVTASIYEKAGHKISFSEFLHYSLPVTFASMLAASVYIAMRYYML